MSNSMPDAAPLCGSARTPALCCECGNVRTVSTDANQRLSDPYSLSEGRSDQRPAESQARGFDVGMQPFWRGLRSLACSACRTQTRHAVIRQDEHRDYAEGQDRACDLDRRELGARLHRLELVGVDVRWDAADDWPARAVIDLHQYRDPSGESWLIVLSKRAEVDSLIRRLIDVERTIDRQEFTHAWEPEDSKAYEWRGKRFAR